MNTQPTSNQEKELEYLMKVTDAIAQHTAQRPTPAHEWRSNFEKYLEQVCFEANPTVLDDDMPDFFDDWLGNQNGEDYIRLADEYAKNLLNQHSAHLVDMLTYERKPTDMLEGWERYWKDVGDGRYVERCMECENEHRILQAIDIVKNQDNV